MGWYSGLSGHYTCTHTHAHTSTYTHTHTRTSTYICTWLDWDLDLRGGFSGPWDTE
jgi:hypothetical protein